MPFNTDSDLINGQDKGQWIQIAKASQTTEGVGNFHSLWKANGMPGAGANPPAFNAGSGYVPTVATAGAMGFGNPASPATSIISIMRLKMPIAGALFVCDRLWACSGFSTVSTSLQSVTTPGTLPSGRLPSGPNYTEVIPWIEVYTAPGATTATWTMTGTDALGNASRTWTYTHPANAETVGQMMPLLPGGASPASHLGCQQVTGFQCSASSGTAGDVGITLARIVGMVYTTGNDQWGIAGPFDNGFARVFDDSCLMMRIGCSTTSTGFIIGQIQIAQN